MIPLPDQHTGKSVTLHIGTHFTASRYLDKVLEANMSTLSEAGVHVPTQRHARSVLIGMLKELDGLPPIFEEEQAVLDRLLGKSPADKILLWDDRWSAPLRNAFEGDHLYAPMARIAPRVAELFSCSEFQISLSVMNPAVFLEFARRSDTVPKHIADFLSRVSPDTLSWRDTIDALRHKLPNVQILIWAEEDAPLIWPNVIRRLAHLPEGAPLTGHHLPAAHLLEAEGLTRLKTYLETHPPRTATQHEQVMTVFLEKYGKPEMLTPTCELPGWTDADIARVSARYEADLIALSEEDGIDVIAPPPLVPA